MIFMPDLHITSHVSQYPVVILVQYTDICRHNPVDVLTSDGHGRELEVMFQYYGDGGARGCKFNASLT